MSHPNNETAPSSTSSIGAAWPPIPTNNNRLKGFYPELVRSRGALSDFEQEFWHSHENRDAVIDRTTVRLIGSSSMLQAAIENGIPVEAAIPVAGNLDLQMIYVGANDDSRTMTADYLKRHQAVLAKSKRAIEKPSIHHNDNFDISALRGGERITQEIVAKFMGLYATFGFSEDDAVELLNNPDNTIAYLQNSRGEILSTCLAEHGVVSLDDYTLSLYEITEAVTRPDMRGKGLYTRVSGALESEVVNNHAQEELATGQGVVVYGESNLSSPGVIYAARRNKRIIAADHPPLPTHPSAAKYGILEQNYKVNDGQEVRRYNDFAVSYQPIR